MPRLDGAGLAKWIAEEKPEVKVLLVSGYATDERLKAADLGEDYGFLPSLLRASSWRSPCGKPSIALWARPFNAHSTTSRAPKMCRLYGAACERR
jgi:hypothetical protein